ncbi:MAG: FAS1-like dehydratase domain-containing protein [Candidatus Dormibacteria bacterium]
MAFNPDCLGRSYHAAPELIDRPRHQAYAEAVGVDPAEARVMGRPLVCFAAVYLLWPTVHQLFTDPEVGLDLEHLLHGEQEFSFEQALAFGDSVHPKGEITLVDRRRGMVFLDFRSEGRDSAGRLLLHGRSRFVVRETA